MSRIVKALKAVYDFFAGDAVLLIAVLVAFAAGALLRRGVNATNTFTVLVFVALIVAGIGVSLARELPRKGTRRK